VWGGGAVAPIAAGGGGLEPGAQSQFGEARFEGLIHPGTREGRFRVFGGSSLRWGGQLLPLPEGFDEAARRWPILRAELEPYYTPAEALLGLQRGSAGDVEVVRQALSSAFFSEMEGVEVELSTWTPFSQRNMARTVGRTIAEDVNASVYLHAQVVEVVPDAAAGRVAALILKNAAGVKFRFEAQQFVLAAGAVETARLLLASRGHDDRGVGNAHGQVGRNFHDHLTLPVAEVKGAARARLLEELRPWVFDGVSHSVKLQASRQLEKRLGLNPVLAHITLEEPEDSGIAAVRAMLTALQQGHVGSALQKHAEHIPAALVEAVKLGWEAKLRNRRFVSKRATVKLQLNVAQDVPSASRITLAEERDANGMPQAIVDWRVSEGEIATIVGFAAHLRERFTALGLDGVEWTPELESPERLKGLLDDARHAMGGTCMGDDPASSVVDAGLKVHGVENLSVVSAGVFPSGSPQLPGLPLMALALRLADRIAGLVEEAGI
jgi:choline dehydrogenase-like flavoprotein